MRLILAAFLFVSTARAEIRIYGDSIFTTRNHAVKQELQKLTNESITDLAQYGDWIQGVNDAYDKNPASSGDVVIFDGGGNDVLWNAWTCKNTPKQSCIDRVDNVVLTISALLYKMEQDGVAAVIYLGVHYPTNFNRGFNPIIDYSYPLIQRACQSSPVCVGVADMRPKITAADLEWDGIHPNNAGAKIIADELYRILEEKNLLAEF